MFLLIDNYDSFTYNVMQSLQSLGVDVLVRRNDQISLDEIKTLAPQGIILSPGPGRPEDAGICMAVIKNFSGKIPILGICLGHQAIAETFGGKVVLSDEVAHGKEASVSHNDGDLYRGLPEQFQVGRYHSLMVDRKTLPSDLLVEADNECQIVMGLRHKEHKTYGVQFHPESILTPLGKTLFKNFIDLCEDMPDSGEKAA